MKLTDFEANLGHLGLHLAGYENAAYYGACEKWSLSLQPLLGNQVNRAKLSIRSKGRDRATVVGRFFAAADVAMTPQLTQDLVAGRDFRGTVGAKNGSFTSIGPELVVNVTE